MIRFSNKPRKVTLMFIVRDKTRSPEQKLEANLRRDIDKIWASIQKPNKSNNIPLSDIFKIEVVFLPNYEDRQAEFKLKIIYFGVKELKGRFVNSTAAGGVADSEEGKGAASGFVISVENIWKDIMENKDLNLPAHKILAAKIRCEQIGNEVCDIFETSERLRDASFSSFLAPTSVSRWTSPGHEEHPKGYLFNRTPPPHVQPRFQMPSPEETEKRTSNTECEMI
ncbi:hypothetical protein L6164_003017 [Bauhinia variegata]|uniref:Uncharacterized protein n=1 Tax=Bauhinia variegata TaxID=167791 RepID=A0ACB9Q032_BAUVA|nr:hypothetical protein L6164_003017 [Bauhinia variegata]